MSNFLSVSVQTRINAPVETAWQVLTEFGSYHTWHPTLTLEPQACPLAVGTLLRGGPPAARPASSQ